MNKHTLKVLEKKKFNAYRQCIKLETIITSKHKNQVNNIKDRSLFARSTERSSVLNIS